MLFQQVHLGIEFNLFFFGETIPPCLKLIGVLDLPCHSKTIITYMEYDFNGMLNHDWGQDWNNTLLASLPGVARDLA